MNQEKLTFIVWVAMIIAAIVIVIHENRKSKKKKQQQPESFQIKEGDILADKEFGGMWCTMEILKIGESGEKCLYKHKIANGIYIDCNNVHEISVSYLQHNFKKIA
jgi:hypothetical protein